MKRETGVAIFFLALLAFALLFSRPGMVRPYRRVVETVTEGGEATSTVETTVSTVTTLTPWSGETLDVGRYPTNNNPSITDYDFINESFNAGSQAGCVGLAEAGFAHLVDTCLYKIAHDGRDADKCGVIARADLREYCVQRVGELSAMREARHGS